MEDLVKVIDTNNRPILVSKKHILSIEANGNNTVIHLAEGLNHYIDKPVEEVIDLFLKQ